MQKAPGGASDNPPHMYAQFFGLNQEPFSIAPDPRYLFMSRRHREALAHLLYGLNGGGGFVLLSGEIGAGKTTVCRCFLEQIPKNCNVAYIFNPKLTVLELLKSICDEFGIAVAPQGAGPATVKDYTDPLNEFLLKTHAAGQNNVLIIDEAQMLSADVLEQLRLLTNLETTERKLLQIILIGQPELRTMLARPELEQLAQRVIARFHLKALSAVETQQYIQHRLSVSGMTRSMPFDRDSVERIHQLSRGIPRRINLLCDRAMLGAYARGTHRIGREIIAKAADEVFGRTEPPIRRKRAKPALHRLARPRARAARGRRAVRRLRADLRSRRPAVDGRDRGVDTRLGSVDRSGSDSGACRFERIERDGRAQHPCLRTSFRRGSKNASCRHEGAGFDSAGRFGGAPARVLAEPALTESTHVVHPRCTAAGRRGA